VFCAYSVGALAQLEIELGPYQQGRNLVEDVNDFTRGFALVVYVWRRHYEGVWFLVERLGCLFVCLYVRVVLSDTPAESGNVFRLFYLPPPPPSSTTVASSVVRWTCFHDA